MINKNSVPNIPDFYLYFQVKNIVFFKIFMINKNSFQNIRDFYLYFQDKNIVFFILLMINIHSFPNIPVLILILPVHIGG